MTDNTKALKDRAAFAVQELSDLDWSENPEYVELLKVIGDYIALTAPAEPVGTVPEGTTMFRVSRLIPMLQDILDRFGDTCVYAQNLSWGAVAMNCRAEDERAGIKTKSVEWSLPMDKATIEMWIDKINLPAGQEVLQEYLRLKACEPHPDAARIAELEAEKRELLEALEPFALYSKSYDPDEGDSDQMAWDAGNTITIGQLRKAAAIHDKLKGDA